MKQDRITKIKKRDNYTCQNPKCENRDCKKLEIHHCYWLSEYNGSNRNQLWNLTTLCYFCHTNLHEDNPYDLDAFCKKIADEREPVRITIRQFKYRKAIEGFIKTKIKLTSSQLVYIRRYELNKYFNKL